MSQSQFTHSTARVPRLYKEAGRIVQKVRLEGGSFKGLVYQSKHKCIKSLYGLVAETLRHGSELDSLLRRTKLLFNEPRLDPWLARVLITEMLWRQRTLSGPAMPLRIVQNYKSQLQSELAALSSDISKPGKRAARPRFVRVNTLKTSTAAVRSMLAYMGWNEVPLDDSLHLEENIKYSSFLRKVNSLSENEFIQDLHIPDLLIFTQSFEFYELEEYHNSSLILQDKASCLSAYLLNAAVGSTVLDMCAAPGMKTTHIAASLKNQGLVYAIEKHRGRYESLCKIVNDSGATCVKPINGDALQFSLKELSNVEYIVVDPSCSGSGMSYREDLFHDSHDVTKERLQKLSGFQCALLRRAMTSFPEVKRIVYSTCSIFPEENEAVVEAVLKSSPPNFVPVNLPSGTSWLKHGSSSYEFGTFGLYTQPDIDLTNGFFIAVFERSENEYILGDQLPLTKNIVTETLDFQCKTIKKKKVKKTKKQPLRSDTVERAVEDDDHRAFEKLKKAMQALNKSSELKQEPGSHTSKSLESSIYLTQNQTQCQNLLVGGQPIKSSEIRVDLNVQDQNSCEREGMHKYSHSSFDIPVKKRRKKEMIEVSTLSPTEGQTQLKLKKKSKCKKSRVEKEEP